MVYQQKKQAKYGQVDFSIPGWETMLLIHRMFTHFMSFLV